MRCLIFAIPLLLAACDKAPTSRAPETDPAVADALADPILADPGLALQRGNAGQIGIPLGGAPDIAPNLPTLGALIKTNAKRFAGCNLQIAYGYGYSAKLPASLPLPDDAKIIEAAGSDTAACTLRAIRYATTRPPADAVSVWKTRPGFVSKDVVGGAEGASGSTVFRVAAQPAAGGATVDVIIRGN